MSSSVSEQTSPPSNINHKSKSEIAKQKPRSSVSGRFIKKGESSPTITIDETIAILGGRLKWCNGKIDLYEDEDKELRYLDNLSKLAGPLMQAFKLRGIEVKDDQDLAKIFEEIAKRRKESSKTIKIFVSET